MAWRIISIENPAYLSLRDNKLVIKQESVVSFPLEDIDSLILDSVGITITNNLLAELTKAKVNTIICDEKHLPSAILASYSQASRGAKVAKAQLNMSEPTRKQLWRKNIMQKIRNQADVLEKYGYPSAELERLAASVRSGDVGNNESVAARIYFNHLLGDATRRKPLWHNSALNYGYAIVRGAIARSVAARGLIASVGMNHHSELNQYNLVDDLIETFRPLVDDFVLSKVYPSHIGEENDTSLSKEDRRILIDILNQYGTLFDKSYSIKHLTDKVVESFVKAILEDDVKELALPCIKR